MKKLAKIFRNFKKKERKTLEINKILSEIQTVFIF